MQMATLNLQPNANGDVRGREGVKTAIQFCVQTVMTSNDSFNQLTSTNIYSGISRSLVFKWHGRFRDGWTESTQHGRKPFMNVRNVLSADKIFSVNVFRAERSSRNEPTGRYMVCGSVTCFRSWYTHRLCNFHTTERTSIKSKQ